MSDIEFEDAGDKTLTKALLLLGGITILALAMFAPRELGLVAGSNAESGVRVGTVSSPTAPAPRPTARPTDHSPQPLMPIQPGTVVPAFARDDAMASVRGMSAIAKRIDRIEAKLTTLGTWLVANEQPAEASGMEPTKLVWIVSVSGQFELPAGHGVELPWGAIVIDARTGAAIGTTGGYARPSSFESLADLARPTP